MSHVEIVIHRKEKEMMFIVDRIEEGIVVCEDLISKEIIEISINRFLFEVKENDVISVDAKNEYVLERKETNERTQQIKSKFEALRKNNEINETRNE